MSLNYAVINFMSFSFKVISFASINDLMPNQSLFLMTINDFFLNLSICVEVYALKTNFV